MSRVSCKFADNGELISLLLLRPSTNQPYMKTEVVLGEINNQTSLNAAIDAIQLQGFKTFTAHALNKSAEDFKSSSRFNQTNNRKILVCVLDGRSSDVKYLASSSSYVRSLGIVPLVIGHSTHHYDSYKELKTIANGDSSDERIYNISNFDELRLLTPKIQEEISKIIPQIEPCQSGPVTCLWVAGKKRSCEVTFHLNPEAEFIEINKNRSIQDDISVSRSTHSGQVQTIVIEKTKVVPDDEGLYIVELSYLGRGFSISFQVVVASTQPNLPLIIGLSCLALIVLLFAVIIALYLITIKSTQ
ncbi:unnamed protein product [Clavelina lepadiformis]|uniref:VWFA domain-containing protein n=1 Tax=Clavelina lepadiformis TaxID=159417 RepID=A0ABP0FEG1_CLALP